MERAISASKSRHLSVVTASELRLTRAQVADRLGTSISTVRRYEGERLHPRAGEDGVRWFDPQEVAALAAERANETGSRRRNAKAAASAADARSAGEIAALAFERFEQRQSLAEIVVGLRIEPALVRTLFDQWTVGLTEGQLRMSREPTVPRDEETPRASPTTLAARLAELPVGRLTRISVGRYRGPFLHGSREYSEIIELGGFLASGPCDCNEVTRRFGRGDYRITAYGLDPPCMSWEMIVEELEA
jgi:hypothetical protein